MPCYLALCLSKTLTLLAFISEDAKFILQIITSSLVPFLETLVLNAALCKEARKIQLIFLDCFRVFHGIWKKRVLSKIDCIHLPNFLVKWCLFVASQSLLYYNFSLRMMYEEWYLQFFSILRYHGQFICC